MNAEVREAAERVRPHVETNLGNASIADRNTLVLAFLEQNPADDEEAITPALLESHGFYQLQSGGSWTHQDVGWYLSLPHGSVFYDECTFCEVANKGEFLRLLRFVGILK